MYHEPTSIESRTWCFYKNTILHDIVRYDTPKFPWFKDPYHPHMLHPTISGCLHLWILFSVCVSCFTLWIFFLLLSPDQTHIKFPITVYIHSQCYLHYNFIWFFTLLVTKCKKKRTLYTLYHLLDLQHWNILRREKIIYSSEKSGPIFGIFRSLQVLIILEA